MHGALRVAASFRGGTESKRLHGLNSGLTAEPVKPTVEEPEDLEEFFHALTQRFRMSTTQNLTTLYSFKVRSGESIESCFAWCNDVVWALEMEEQQW